MYVNFDKISNGKFMYMKKLSLLLFVMFFTVATCFAATRTWTNASGGAWTTAANWGGTAPIAGDVVVFNISGTYTVTSVPAVALNQVSVTAGTVTLTATGGNTLTVGPGSNGNGLSISSGASLLMGTNVGITIAASSLGQIDGTLNVGASVTFNTNGTSVVTTVSTTGAIVNNGTVTTTTATKLFFNGSSNYTHNATTTFPTATWSAASTCTVNNCSTSSGTGNHNFGNVINN